MKFGYIRYTKQLDIIGNIIKNALNSDNPTEYIYQNDLRTPFFMLEGLCRMYKYMHDSKVFKKLLAQAKAVEDALGKYDFYFVLYNNIAENELLPQKLKQYIAQERDNASIALNELMQQEEWWSGKRLYEWNKKLRKLDWQSEKKEIALIQKFFEKEIDEVIAFVNNAPFPFEDMEEDVHELRRILRWLSIYCHALDGVVALVDIHSSQSEQLQKYCTEKIIHSPFNKFTPSYRYKYHLLLNKSNFLALSWMIATIGELKDQGLELQVVYSIVANLQLDTREKQAIDAFLQQYDFKISTILEQVTEVTTHFLADRVLHHLCISN